MFHDADVVQKTGNDGKRMRRLYERKDNELDINKMMKILFAFISLVEGN